MPSKLPAAAATALVLAATTHSLFKRPVFTSSGITLFSFSVWFVASEASEVHNSNEMDDFSVFAAVFFCSIGLVNGPDSPLRRLPGPLRWAIPFFLGAVQNFISRRRHRAALLNGVTVKRHWPRTSFGPEDARREQVAEAVQAVQETLGALDPVAVPTLLKAFVHFRHVLHLESRLLEIFGDEELSGESLSSLVLRAPTALVMYKVKNHMPLSVSWGTLVRLWRQSGSLARTLRPGDGSQPFLNRANFIRLLGVVRLGELSLPARAIVLDSLQTVRLNALDAESTAAHILLSTKGADLTALKCLCDSKGTHRSLHRLIFSDFPPGELRDRLLEHFGTQAVHAIDALPRAGDGRRQVLRKVLSDVDDTFLSSGAHFPAGIDGRFQKKQIYPGVAAFMRQLDTAFGLSSELLGSETGRKTGNVTFLSARPRVHKGVMENQLFDDFAKLQDEDRFHCMPAMLGGDLESGYAYMRRGDFEPMATKKLQNFLEYCRLYPEYSFVFIGDNGQGDLRAGARMLDEHPDLIEAVFIHIVQPVDKTHGIDHYRSLRPEVRRKLVLFRDYADAALAAVERGLFPLEGLGKVLHAARAEFLLARFHDGHAREVARLVLNSTLEAAGALPDGPATPEPVPASQEFEDEAEVVTPYGRGRTLEFREADGFYKVELDGWNAMVWVHLLCVQPPPQPRRTTIIFGAMKSLRNPESQESAARKIARMNTSNLDPTPNDTKG